MDKRIILLVILLAAVFLRFYPAVQSDEMLKFDSYYHARTAELIKEEGFVKYEPYPYGGKPLLYPPGYHLLLIFFSFLGFELFSLAEFMLAFIFVICIIGSYWLVKKHSNEKAALITAFLLAVNPVLITESFGSPQVIGFLFFLAAVHFYFEKKHVLSGLTMGACFWFTPMGAFFFSLPIIILSVSKRKKQTRKFILPALAVSALWLLTRVEFLYSLSSSAFDFFAVKIPFQQFINPWYLLLVALVIPFTKCRNDFQKIFLILAVSSFIFYLSFAFTNVFHPWRQTFFLMIGLSFLAADVFSKNKKMLVAFSAVCLFLIYALSFPGLSPADFRAIQQFENNDLVLAGHDTCAVIMANTEAQCMLDICFESIGNEKQFKDMQSFLWASKPEQVTETIGNYGFNKVMIGSDAWGESILNEFDVNKNYISFECWGDYCMKPASIYEVIR